LSKTGGIGDGEISQHFSIQLNTCFIEPAYKFTVGQVIHAGGGNDPDNPKAPEFSFTNTTIAIGIPERPIDRIGRRSEKFAVATTETLGQL
jgi:hypothetical protein